MQPVSSARQQVVVVSVFVEANAEPLIKSAALATNKLNFFMKHLGGGGWEQHEGPRRAVHMHGDIEALENCGAEFWWGSGAKSRNQSLIFFGWVVSL